MRLLREEECDLNWAGSQDIGEELESLQAENSWVEPSRLLRVADFAEAAERIRETIRGGAESAAEITRIARSIPRFTELSRSIRRCITSAGEVADRASPELGRLRRGLERTRREVVSSLERFFSGTEESGAVQEKIITLRQERYVIPVKAGSRGLIPGLVHDRSASGQTLFIEPHSAVELNNALREMAAEEKEEVRRILRQLASEIRERREDLEQAMTRLGLLEGIWARAVISEDFDMVAPVVFSEPGRIDLHGARHPLLERSIGAGIVPIDFSLGEETRTLVLTGPNTGGKTVALKTAGLLCLMAQSGLQIPALPGSGLSCFAELLADIGDEQSIQQNLSTFSGHMKNIITVLERSRPGGLVLLDELGAGTDPAEGAALAIAILEEIHASGALTVATTHHNAVKVFAAVTPGVANASMEFDDETLGPTYRLVTGVPGRSHAFRIAARLGMTVELIEQARRHQAAGDVKLDRLMADLERERRSVSRERASLEETRRRLEREESVQAERWERKSAKLEREGKKALRLAERELDEALRSLKKSDARPAAARASMEKIRKVMEGFAPAPHRPAVPAETLFVGGHVFVRTLRAWGTLVEVGKESAIVRVEGRRCTVPFTEIEEIREKGGGRRREMKGGRASYSVEVPAIGSSEVDVRGLRADEALRRLERFIEHALLNGLGDIAVIHGKGWGRLQAAVAEYLADHPRVESFGAAPLEQGGTGMTKVKLAL
jgi:DNA mismatch repair protein MutS2